MQIGPTQDDLFDDVVPADGSMHVRSEEDLFGDDFTPLAQPIVEEPPPTPNRARGDGRGDGSRGRGRGGGRGRGRPTRGGAVESQISHQNGQMHTQERAVPPEDAPSGPRKESHPSVRGDRRATGGNFKSKLSEAELAEKMAAVKIKNASLTAAHARAEADAANFAQREAAERAKARQKDVESKQKAKEERRDRQQMMGEREKNRMRKLKAMEGREWDAEKEENDFGKGGKFDGKAFAGDQEGYNTDGREYLYQEPRTGGGSGGSKGARHIEKPVVPVREDFPALPGTSKNDIATTSPSEPTLEEHQEKVQSKEPELPSADTAEKPTSQVQEEKETMAEQSEVPERPPSPKPANEVVVESQPPKAESQTSKAEGPEKLPAKQTAPLPSPSPAKHIALTPVKSLDRPGGSWADQVESLSPSPKPKMERKPSGRIADLMKKYENR